MTFVESDQADLNLGDDLIKEFLGSVLHRALSCI